MKTKLLTIALLVTASQLTTAEVATAAGVPVPTTPLAASKLPPSALQLSGQEANTPVQIPSEVLHKAVKTVARDLESTLEQRFQEDFSQLYTRPGELAIAH